MSEVPAAGRDGLPPSAEPPPSMGRLHRFLPLVDGMVERALDHVDAPPLLTAAWRDRPVERDLWGLKLRRQLELAEPGAGLDEADLAALSDRFAALARRGASLGAVRDLDRAVTARTVAELWERAEPDDVPALLRLSRWMVRHSRDIEGLMVRAHATAMMPGPDGGDPRAIVVEQLLAGIRPRTPAGMPVAVSHLVVVTDAGVLEGDGVVAGALSVVRGGHRVLLVPLAGAQVDPAVWEILASTCRREGAHAGGALAVSAADVPKAVATASGAAGVARATGRPPGVYAPDDVLLEDVLRQSPDGSARLAAVLGPLEVDTRLIDTLVAFFAHDLDRSRTAAALDLSRGGLGLRLNRIATLTGLDPRTTRGIQVLTAALSARALVGLAGRAPGG